MYGQTTSGKTYTMLGDENSAGIVIYSLIDVFDRVKNINLSKNTQKLKIVISYMEIYNEQVNDLLNPDQTNLKIVDASVPNLTQFTA